MIKFLKSKKFKVSLFEGSTYLFVGTLPLFLSINTIAIWIFVVSSFIVLGFKKRKEILWKRRAFIIPFILLFFFIFYWVMDVFKHRYSFKKHNQSFNIAFAPQPLFYHIIKKILILKKYIIP